jgi:hypothetical protein
MISYYHVRAAKAPIPVCAMVRESATYVIVMAGNKWQSSCTVVSDNGQEIDCADTHPTAHFPCAASSADQAAVNATSHAADNFSAPRD